MNAIDIIKSAKIMITNDLKEWRKLQRGKHYFTISDLKFQHQNLDVIGNENL